MTGALTAVFRKSLRPALLLTAFAGSVTAQAQSPLALAQGEIQKGRTAEAIRVLEDYRRQHPAVAEAYNLLGVAYTSEGKTDQALAMYQEFARLAPNRPEAYNNLGASFLQHGDSVQAEKAFRQALALRADDTDALYNLGSLLNTRHDYNQARPLLARALRRERTPGIVFELAASQAGVGDRKQALRTLSSMPVPSGPEGLPWLRLVGTLSLDEGRWTEGGKALEQALKLAPDDQIVLYSLGLARLKSNQPAEAASLFERAFASMPIAERHFKTGALLAQHGADADAVTQFERAVREDPKMYDAYFNLAVIHLRRKEINSAAEAAAHALAIRKTGEAYSLLGDLREEQGQYREALESLQQAVRLEPQNEEFAFDLGLELILHENSDAAMEWFRAAQEHFPQSARMALGLGTANYMAEKQDDAVRAFLKAVDLDPKYEPAYTFLGMAYLSSSNPPDEVLGRLGMLARSHPQSFTAQYYYGATLVKAMDRAGKAEKAEAASEALRRALALHPDDAHTYYYLGEIKRLQDRIDEAALLYEKSVALDPTFADALFKLGRAYAKLGRQEDALRVLARHHEVQSRQAEDLEKRMQEIKTFVLTMRSGR